MAKRIVEVSLLKSWRVYDKREFELKGKAILAHVKGQLILNDSFMALKAALDCLWLIYTNENTVKDKLDSGKLEVVLEQYPATSAGFYPYYPQPSQVLLKLRVFINYLRAEGVT